MSERMGPRRAKHDWGEGPRREPGAGGASPAVLSIDRFIDQLCELELDPVLLRNDPRGEQWLPASLQRMVAEDPECARELDEFVAMELELFDMHEPSDAFFTRRVMDQLPEIEAIDDRRRTWILASAYALAIGVAYVLLGPLLSSGEISKFVASLERWQELRNWSHGHAIEGMWIALALLLTAGVLTLMPAGRRRTPDASV